jgi:probable F420-dependent oxidoreductase
MAKKNFRLGMQMTSAPTRAEWIDLARRFEGEGYQAISTPDHLGPQFAPIPALASVAVVTDRVKLSMFVLANDYRNPAVLAKEVTSLDVLSGGRVELGIGAGWNTVEFAAQGVPFDRPGTRIDRLAEAITVLKGAFAGGPFSHAGRYYHVDDLNVLPRPVRPEGIPFVLGGGGKRMLTLAGQQGNVVSISTNNSTRMREVGGSTHLGSDVVAEQISWVRDAAGPRFESIELHIRVFGVAVRPTREEGAEALAAQLGDPKMLLRSPFVWVGPIEAIHEQMLRYREELGISYYTVSQRHADMVTPLIRRVAGT